MNATPIRKLKFGSASCWWNRLPFVGNGTTLARAWAVPATGGYIGGNRTGRALAQLYLKELQRAVKSGEHSESSTLQHVVLAMAERLTADCAQDASGSSLQGQVVGFFTEINAALVTAAQRDSAWLGQLDSNECLRRANEGLTGSDEERMTAMAEAESRCGVGS